jgi:hypothetical protein
VEKLFTPAQANRTLPLVRSIVDDILLRARELRGKAALARAPESDPELTALKEEVRRLMGELEALGCSFKDWSFDVGLVDFPAEIAGERVLLCWRSDEKRVAHYHSIEGGFAARQPIPPELLEDGS